MSKQQQIKPNNLPPKKTYYNIDDALRDSAQPRANEYDSINSLARHIPDNLVEAFKKPIGLYDPFGENVNPFTGLPYKNLYSDKPNLKKISYDNIVDISTNVPIVYPNVYKSYAYGWAKLKMYANLTNLIKLIDRNQVILLIAGTGTGKTVITPRAALQYFNFQKKICVSVPKIKLTVEHAEYTSICFDTVVGNEIGYQSSKANKTNKNTKLTFITAGSLKSIIVNKDPLLSEYSCVIIDEAHERSVDIDQLFLLMKPILLKRPEMKLIIMSATVDPNLFRNEFQNKAGLKYGQLIVEGDLTYPITLTYEDKILKGPGDVLTAGINKIYEILTTKPRDSGDILYFVKSIGGAQQIIDGVMNKLKDKLDTIFPYFATLDSKTKQNLSDYALGKVDYKNAPKDERYAKYNYSHKVVIATEVAESSLTINNLSYVIDTCEANISGFLPLENAEGLIAGRISKANADQRKGRVGRVGPGLCHRLITENEFANMVDFPTPEIKRKDITMDILDLFSLSSIKTVADLRVFLNQFIDPPAPAFIANSINKLFACGALKIDKSDAAYLQKGGTGAGQNGGAVIDLYTLIKNLESKKQLRKPVAPVKELSNKKLLKESKPEELQLSLINKLDERKDGKLTDLGKVLKKFREISLCSALSIIVGYYLNCANEICNIIAIGKLTQFRMDSLFERYKPKNKNVDLDTQKRERNILLNKQKRFYHKFGDHMTMLNVYNELKAYMEDSNNITIGGQSKDMAQMAPMAPKTTKNPREWCRLNGIVPNALISKDFKSTKQWDGVKEEARKLKDTVRRAIQPAELKLKYYDEYVANERNRGNNMIISREKLLEEYEKEIMVDSAGADEDVITDAIEAVHSIDKQIGGRQKCKCPEEDSCNKCSYIKGCPMKGGCRTCKKSLASIMAKQQKENIRMDAEWEAFNNFAEKAGNQKAENQKGGAECRNQKGGARRPNYEYNLFPILYTKGKKEHDILYSLFYGHKINLAKYNKESNSYISLFPIKKSKTIISEYSVLKGQQAEYIIYDSLQYKNQGAKVFTMNACSIVDLFEKSFHVL